MRALPLARQGARFLLIGLAATVLHVVVALSARRLIDAPSLAANFLGYACALGISYAGNVRWTFGAAAHGAQFARFLVVSLTGLAVNQALTFLVVDIAQLSFAVALGLVVTVVPLITFALSRAWVFRGSNG